jgi:uncharacterized membrane protein YidH (DUF202 family)
MKENRKLRPKVLLLLGSLLIVAGFLYDLAFAGIPYQDPTPSLQANWELQQNVAAFIIITGVIVFIAGIVWFALKKLMRIP